MTSLSPEDPNPGNNTATANVVVPNSADLRLLKTQSTDTPVAGVPDDLTYTLTVTNDGPGSASDVLLSDAIPAEFTPTVVNATGALTCNTPGAGGQLVCTVGSLAPSQTETVTVTGTVIGSAQAVLVRNVGRVTSTTLDPDPTNNDDTTLAVGAPAADLGVTKEWGSESGAFTQITTAPANSNVRVRLSVTNHGPSAATGVVLSDVLPANISYVSDDGGCGAVGQTVTCPVGALAVDAQFVVLVTVNIGVGAAGTIVSNTASVGGAEADPIGSNDSATDADRRRHGGRHGADQVRVGGRGRRSATT